MKICLVGVVLCGQTGKWTDKSLSANLRAHLKAARCVCVCVCVSVGAYLNSLHSD